MLALFTVLSMLQMFQRLHTPTPEDANLTLKTAKGKAISGVPEFFVAGEPPPTARGAGSSSGGGFAAAAAKGAASASGPTENTNLLCMERPGKGRV